MNLLLRFSVRMHNTAGHCPLQSLSTLLPLYPIIIYIFYVIYQIFLIIQLQNILLLYKQNTIIVPNIFLALLSSSYSLTSNQISLNYTSSKTLHRSMYCSLLSLHSQNCGTLQVLFAPTPGYSVFHILLPLLPWLPLQLAYHTSLNQNSFHFYNAPNHKDNGCYLSVRCRPIQYLCQCCSLKTPQANVAGLFMCIFPV